MTAPTQNTVAEQTFDIDATFDSAGSGGSGAPSFAWPADPRNPRDPLIGGEIVGEITDIFATVVKDAKTKQPKVNKRGQQMPQFNLTIKTSLRNWEGCKSVPVDEETNAPLPASEDDGSRRIYVKYRMLDALAKAIRESEQGKGGPRIGAKVSVKVTALEDVGQINPLPDYEARYRPAPEEAKNDAAFDQAAAASGPAADPWASAPSGKPTDEPPF